MATTLDELATEALAAASKPYSVRNDRLTVRQHRLKDLVELHNYLTSNDALDTSATQIDAETAVMPGVRTNKLAPDGAV